jgi:hypothetical protein
LLKVTEENERYEYPVPDLDPDPYQNVTDPHHWNILSVLLVLIDRYTLMTFRFQLVFAFSHEAIIPVEEKPFTTTLFPS